MVLSHELWREEETSAPLGSVPVPRLPSFSLTSGLCQRATLHDGWARVRPPQCGRGGAEEREEVPQQAGSRSRISGAEPRRWGETRIPSAAPRRCWGAGGGSGDPGHRGTRPGDVGLKIRRVGPGASSRPEAAERGSRAPLPSGRARLFPAEGAPDPEPPTARPHRPGAPLPAGGLWLGDTGKSPPLEEKLCGPGRGTDLPGSEPEWNREIRVPW